MARKKNVFVRAGEEEDRLSALPDDLLLEILRRVDTRSALGAAALSKRWAYLPRELPALDLRVTDLLPPRYHRCLLLRDETRRSRLKHESQDMLEATAGRYERRAMRAMVGSVKSLLAAAANANQAHRRRVSRLSLEVFTHDTSDCINRLVVNAVDSWGVEDLEVVAKRTGPIKHPPPAYSFPFGCISENLGGENSRSHLRSLKLANCVIPPLRGLAALTKVVLQDLPYSTPARAYEGVVTSCPQLQVLHLVSCMYKAKRRISSSGRVRRPWPAFNAPMLELRELVVDGRYMTVEIWSLPKLERLACLQSVVHLCSSKAAPCLSHVSLACSVDDRKALIPGLKRGRWNHFLPPFFQRAAVAMTDLVLRFTGPEMWIAAMDPFPGMSNLRRLVVADLPSSWGVTWPRLLVEAAPLLETLVVHVSHCEEEEEPPETVGRQQQQQEILVPESSSSTSCRRHLHLKELVIIGFENTERHILLVRFAVEVSTAALRRVSLFRHGHVEEKGPCGWEVVSQPSAWSSDERRAILDGIRCSMAKKTEVVLS